MKSQAIISLGNWMGVVVAVEEGWKQDRATIREKRTDDGWRYTLERFVISRKGEEETGRRETYRETWTRKRRMSATETERRLANLPPMNPLTPPPNFRPMPKELKRAALEAVFPRGKMSNEEWLAWVSKGSGEAYAQAELIAAIPRGDYTAGARFDREWRTVKNHKRSMKDRVAIALFGSWSVACEPGMNGLELRRRLGLLDVEPDTFSRTIRRLGVRLAKPGQPKKNPDKLA